VRDNERLMPGEGVIDLNSFLMALHEIGYQDARSVEVFGRHLKDMTPEELIAYHKKLAAQFEKESGIKLRKLQKV